MSTPESLVFGGREGSGAAQVFGHPYDVVNAYRQGKANDERQQQLNQAVQAKAKQDRDKKINELLLTDPAKTFEPFQKQINSSAEEHRAKFIDAVNKGADPDSLNFKAWNKKGWENNFDLAAKGNLIEKAVKDKRDEVAKNKYLDSDVLNSAISDTYMNEHGEGHAIDKIDFKNIADVVKNNPQAFKANSYGNDFLKDLGNTVFKYNELQRNAEGVSTEGYVEKLKKGIYQEDPNAADGVLRNQKTGLPVINITPEVVHAFQADPNAQRWVEYESKKTGMTPKDVIQKVLAPQVGEDRQHVSNFKYAPQNYKNEFGFNRNLEPSATERARNLHLAANGFFDTEGNPVDNPSEEAVSKLAYLTKNAKIGNANITNGFFVKGTDEKGGQDINGMHVENKPYNRIVFSTKEGIRGRAKPYEIDLSNKQGAMAELNAIHETAKAEGGFHIGMDQLRAYDQASGGKHFEDQRKAVVKPENDVAMNEEIEKWRGGKNLGGIMGKTFGGKEIINVKHSPPTMGFLGKNTLELKLSDGSTQQINTNDSDDLKKLRSIYKSGDAKKLSDPKKSGDAKKLSDPKKSGDAKKLGFDPKNPI